MTSFQEQLIDKLNAKKIEAKFNGAFLNCRVAITNKETGKIKWQRFSFLFDTADDCQGSRLVGHVSGAYAEHFAKDASEIIVGHSCEVAALEL